MFDSNRYVHVYISYMCNDISVTVLFYMNQTNNRNRNTGDSQNYLNNNYRSFLRISFHYYLSESYKVLLKMGYSSHYDMPCLSGIMKSNKQTKKILYSSPFQS